MRLVSMIAPLAVLFSLCVGAPAEPCNVHADNHAVPPQAPQPETFDPSVAHLDERTPEWTARQLIAQQQYSAAADLLEAALVVPGDADSVGRQRFLLAKAQHEAGRDEAALASWAALSNSTHPLSHWARLRLADGLTESDPSRALSLLASLQHGHAFSRRAQLLEAMALRAAGHDAQAIKALRALLESAPNNRSGAFAAMPLAELLANQGARSAKIEAIQLWQRVESRAPNSRAGQQAKERLTELLGQIPKAARRKLLVDSTEDDFARGEALMREHDYEAAVAVFGHIAGKADDDLSLRCKAELQQGRALLKKRDRPAGAKLMGELLGRCKNRDLRAWAHYYAGQAHLRLNEPEKALQHYDALSSEAPRHRLADDGLFQGALAAADADDRDGMRQRLQQLVDDHPKGDMHQEALFTLAWDARKRGDAQSALGYFEHLATRSSHGQPEGMHGRADYWRARTLAELGRKSEAIAGYAALVQSFPLSYHAQQALARLQELDPSECKRLQQWLKAEDEQPLLFPVSAPMQQPGFQAALALLQIGETALAAQEFRYLGLSRSHAKDTLWLLAALYDAAGAYPQASALARGRLRKFMTEAPKGQALRRWRIAYPNAFAPLVEQAAAEAHVPAAYVRAVAREESAFNPEAVSSAHAYGLIQLMRATAKQYAQRLGLPSHPGALKDPQTNLRIGSHYIEFLWKRYQSNPAIVPAAYNAGHGSVERWLRAKPEMPLDEFIESIPFGETRRYSRRVLQSYGIYAFLQQGSLPPLRAKLPLVE